MFDKPKCGPRSLMDSWEPSCDLVPETRSTAERILYYMENIFNDIGPENLADPEETQKFIDKMYIWCHIGTARLHACKHPDWEEEFSREEKEMVAGGITSYDEIFNRKLGS